MKKLVILTLLLLSALIVACAPSSDLPPEPGAPGTAGGAKGLAGRAIAGGEQYADPTTFTISPTLFQLAPGNFSLNLYAQANEQFVYRFGYVTDNEGQWKQFEYSCSQPIQNWCRNNVSRVLNVSLEKNVVGENYIVAYGCTKQQGQWNCHSNKWMLQMFTVSAPPPNVTTNATPNTSACTADQQCQPGLFCNEQGQCEALPLAPEELGGTQLVDDCFDGGVGVMVDNDGDGTADEGCKPYTCNNQSINQTNKYNSTVGVFVMVTSANGQLHQYADYCYPTASTNQTAVREQNCKKSGEWNGYPGELNISTTISCTGGTKCQDPDGVLGPIPAVCK